MKRKELLIHSMTWMNLKIITLSEKTYTKSGHAVLFYLYKLLRNGN